MKTKDYVKKYNLENTDKFNHDQFISDFTADFLAVIEFHSNTKNWNYSIFKNCVSDIRKKWDNISNKTKGQLPEKLWSYFYASVVCKLRDDMFGEFLKQRKEAYEEKRRWKEDMFRGFNPWENIFSGFKTFLMGLTGLGTPLESFETLGLTQDASEAEVKESYRLKALEAHPDKGGDHDQFIKLTEAKNKCLMYLKRKETTT